MHAAGWKSRIAIIAGLALAAAPGLAGAEDAGGSGNNLLTSLGEYVLIGGGVTDFAKQELKDRFDVGGSWDARLGIGSRYYVGGELAYVGSSRSGKGGANDLLTNGAEAVVRVQYPWTTSGWLVEPFAFGGIGWTRVSVQDAPAGVKDSDDIGTVPFGAGVTLGRRPFLLDVRFTYRPSFAEDLTVGSSGTKASFDQWNVGVSIGWEF